MNTLPPEILCSILKPDPFGYYASTTTSPLYPTSKKYLRLRLVNRMFCAIISPYAFKYLRISSRNLSLHKLQNISRNHYLNGFVKEYIFTPGDLWETIVPVAADNIYLADKYAKFISLPENEQSKAFIRMSKTERLSIEEFNRTKEFGLSRELYDVHRECLPLLPNLNSIRIMTFSCGTLSEVLQPYSEIIGEIFRGILEALYQRDQIKASPIEELVIQEITENCILLPKTFITRALSGFRALKKISITLLVAKRLISRGDGPLTPPGWVFVVGRFLQTAKALESLSIQQAFDSQLDDDEAQLKLHLRAFITPCDFNGSKILRVQHWPNLSILDLCHCLFTGKLLLTFLEQHKATLKHLYLTKCELRPQKGNSETDNEELMDEDDWPPERIKSKKLRLTPEETWPHILRTLRPSTAPSRLESLELSTLTFGINGHDHMHSTEQAEWEDWILGRSDTESEPVSLGTDHKWCFDCPEIIVYGIEN